MSQEFLDEIEAINSIYGDGSLQPTDDECIYQLKLPDASCLRLLIPDSYPASTPPTVIGTTSSHQGVKGAGTHDQGMFQAVLDRVFTPPDVCLYDALDELARHQDLERREQVKPHSPRPVVVSPTEEPPEPPEPPAWITSETVTCSKSRFVARVLRVSTAEEALRAVRHLRGEKSSATHHIVAWRVRWPVQQDCDDDGETAAGGRLLHLLGVMDVWGVVVVVSRWFGGVKLGGRRFALINRVARDGLVRAGVV